MIVLEEPTYEIAEAALAYARQTGQGDTWQDIAKRAFHGEVSRLFRAGRTGMPAKEKGPSRPVGRPPIVKCKALAQVLLAQLDTRRSVNSETYKEQYNAFESAIQKACDAANLKALEWFDANRPWFDPANAVLPDFVR